MKNYFLSLLIVFAEIAIAQKNKTATDAPLPFDTAITNEIQFRCIGPWRGGRSTAVAGDLQDKNLFYFGSTGGGVWKTIDGGNNWKNISDGFFGGSIGSVAVSKSDPSIIYVGTGENSLRGNVSEGNGIWKTENGGRTWKNIGLTDTRHIFRIVIHPKNPDIVYVSALGHLFGPNTERGIFRTKDGGKTWSKILYVNENVGACDLIIDPTEPNNLLVSFWNVKRTPYSLESGGIGSGIYKTTDGGDNWINISNNKGLPKDTLGIIGITICPSNPNKYYAIIESKTGGVFVSEDAGKTWNKTNDESKLRQRAWYFSKIFADPKDENIIYVLNVQFWKSIDGGKTFNQINTPHGDHHDLWIDPNDGNRMIIGDDGGAQISFDSGKNWSTYQNQPTAQFYRVSTDNAVPYRILGAQQDNSSVRIRHRSLDGEIDGNDWEPTAGFESGHIVADPKNPDIVYGGNYSGFLGMFNHITNDNRALTVWPEDPIGQGGEFLKYRFQWNFPIFFSPHDSTTLYAAGNVLFKTTDKGTTWVPISPDLTTNDKSKQQKSGGIITKDNTGVEMYCTIFAAAESVLEKDLIYAGSDDGLLHVTKDGGKNWENITPPDLPRFTLFNCIEIDPFDKGKMYFAATRYKLDDNTPYLYVTKDYGRTWKKITKGINPNHFTRVIRCDQKIKGLLYCGTENGLYISYDEGNNWFAFQNNLPIVPITDITIKNNDLIIATQGRSFWILDDLSILQSMNYEIAKHPAGAGEKNLHVYPVRNSFLIGGSQNEKPVNAGMNPKPGVVINYYLKNDPDTNAVEVTIYDHMDSVIKIFSTKASDKDLQFKAGKGLNQFSWDMQYPPAKKIDGMFLWNGTPTGLAAAPGNYKTKIKYGKDSVITEFIILRNPNSEVTDEDHILQHQFLEQITDKFNETQAAILEIRSLRTQLNDYVSKLGDKCPKELKDKSEEINKQLTAIEDVLYETKNKSEQDMLNHGIKLNDKLAGLYNAVSFGNFRPSQNSKEVFNDLSKQIDVQLEKLNQIKKTDIAAMNELIRKNNLPAIITK
ncbi:MAG: glycosyl hydrolase [Fimbriimonadaceae bacterium]|nr:glycosyl hydrolase [Chitinophagales bacterium]